MPKKSLSDLKATVTKLKEPDSKQPDVHQFLVFVDEVPPEHFHDADGVHMNPDFHAAINLRNVLRYVGIAPIMMSTHADMINAMEKSGSGLAQAGVWTVVFPVLPPFVTRMAPPQNEFLRMLHGCLSLDRPLVSQILAEYIEQSPADLHDCKAELQKLIEKVAVALYTRHGTRTHNTF